MLCTGYSSSKYLEDNNVPPASPLFPFGRYAEDLFLFSKVLKKTSS